MTSSSKEVTENTPQSSSAANTGESGQPSAPSVNSDNTPKNTQTTKVLSKPTSKGASKDRTTLHAMFLRAAFSYLKRAGLARSFKVLSKDGTTVQEIIIVLDAKYWTEALELKVLSQ